MNTRNVPRRSRNSLLWRPLAVLLVMLMSILTALPPAVAEPGAAPASQSRRVISGVHTDAIAVFAESSTLELATKADVDGETEVRFDPNLIIFNVEEATRTTVPSNPSYSFLGTAGSDIWLAPEVQQGGQIWPGFSTEDVPTGYVDGDQMTLRLESVSGPGTVHIFQSDAFGEPIRRFSSVGTEYREWSLLLHTHAHANWAFSAAGTYVLTFKVSATIGGTPMTDTRAYTFHVGNVPAAVATTTAVSAGATSILHGNAVTLTATVTPSQAVGWVEFLDGTTVLGHEAVNAGSAALTTMNLGLGVRSVTARFVPQWLNDFSASTSAPVMINVTGNSLVPFTMPNFVDTNSTSASAPQLADLNRDGNIDLAISGAQGVGYLLGTGAGSFLPAQFIPGGSGSRSDLVAVDFDGDGDIDLLNTQANAGDTADILSLYRNDGSANFTRVELIPALPRLSSQIEAADLNGDGRPDVIFGKGNTGVAYAQQQVNGTLGAEVILPVTTTTASVQVADLDADGDPDIVVGNRTGSNGGAIFIFKNNGSGTFAAAPSVATGNFPSVLKLADMDGDGRVDIFTTQLIANTRAGWYPQLPDGSFGPRVNVMTAITQLNAVEVADINEDGVPDIVAGVILGNFVSVWSPGLGGGTYGNPILLDANQGNCFGMRVADLDGDSHPDIIATGTTDSTKPSAVRVLINKVGEDPMVLFTPAERIRVTGDPIDLEIYFGFPVTVTGTPRVALQVGANTVFATYLSGSGTGKLVFRYLVAASDLDLDGVQLAGNVIDLNGGTILDPLNGNAVLTFPNLAFNGVIANGAGPLVQNITRLDSTPTTATSVRFQVLFAEAVTGVDVADFELKQDAGDLAGGSVLSVTGSGSTYEVDVATGTGSGTLGLSVKNAASIADLAGDPLAKSYVGGQVYTLKRGAPPVISAIYRNNHADYRPIWNNGEITFALDADAGTLGPVATVLPSDEVLTYAGPSAIVARAATNTYDFMGVPAGSNVYVLPSSQVAGLPFLGISGESVPSGTFARYSPATLLGDSRITSTNAYMRFQLVAMRSSSGGQLSIYTISSGNPRVWIATSDGISSADAVYETPGGHSHRNVAFSKPGTYEVDVFVSGYRDANANTTYDPVTDPYIESGIFTMVFHVGDTSQVSTFNDLADSYQQGDAVNLSLIADPALTPGDTIAWEWKLPGGDWTLIPGATGLSHSIVAEQAIDGAQVRATLTVVSDSSTLVAGPVTIQVDDHGAAALQQPTVAGATRSMAGQRVTLTRELPANGATVLTTHRWERKAAGTDNFAVIPGAKSAQLSFNAALTDDGAEYRVSILKPDGTVAYGPSPVVTLSVEPGPSRPFYQIVDLGTVGGPTSFGLDVNNNGQVTGNSRYTTANTRLHAYVWSEGVITDIGYLTNGVEFSRGYAINDDGVIVGESDNSTSKAFIWDNVNGMQNLGTLGGPSAVATDINNNGEIVGASSDGTASRPFYRSAAGVMTDLGTLLGTPNSTGRAWAINEAGVIVGFSRNAANTTSQATLWQEGAIISLGSLGSGEFFSQAYALNESLQIVGTSVAGKINPTSSTDLYRAFLWENGVMIDLGAHPSNAAWIHSEAKDINDAGQVVGYASQFSGNPSFGGAAMLWQNGEVYDLNKLVGPGSGWNLVAAEGINDHGEIVGYGTFGGQSRAFLLRPMAQLSEGEVEVGLAYEDGVLDLHVHDHSNEVEYEAGAALLRVMAPAQTIVPENPAFSFLGTPGSKVWILPQTETPKLLFLGVAAEEIESGVFVGNELKIALKAVSGPGHVIQYTGGGLGSPVVAWNSADGINAADVRILSAGGHEHVNWAFTAPGIYRITLEATGTLVDGNQAVSSGEVSYFIEVVPIETEVFVGLQTPELLTVSFVTQDGLMYQLETAASLEGPWTEIGEPFEGNGLAKHLSVAISGQAGFFRLKTVTPE